MYEGYKRVQIPASLLISAEFLTCATVLEGEAVLIVASVGQVSGEEAACNGHDYADEDRVPGHVEYIAYVFLGEVGHHYVVYVEEDVAARIAEDDGHDE